jgi:hypothetical protein
MHTESALLCTILSHLYISFRRWSGPSLDSVLSTKWIVLLCNGCIPIERRKHTVHVSVVGAFPFLQIIYFFKASEFFNEELHKLYSFPSIIRMIKPRMRWAGHVARMGEKRNAWRILVGKPEGKRPLESPRRRWTDNIKLNLREI